jgi:hypothetical protein
VDGARIEEIRLAFEGHTDLAGDHQAPKQASQRRFVGACGNAHLNAGRFSRLNSDGHTQDVLTSDFTVPQSASKPPTPGGRADLTSGLATTDGRLMRYSARRIARPANGIFGACLTVLRRSPVGTA